MPEKFLLCVICSITSYFKCEAQIFILQQSVVVVNYFMFKGISSELVEIYFYTIGTGAIEWRALSIKIIMDWIWLKSIRRSKYI